MPATKNQKDKLKLKLAKKHDAGLIAKLFSSIRKHVKKEEVTPLIEDKKVFVLKKKKKIVAAFSYAVLGITGLFAVMYIKKLAVDKNFRKKGIGSLLLSKIKSLTYKMGAWAFFLFSLKKAKKFYSKNKLSYFGRLFWWKK